LDDVDYEVPRGHATDRIEVRRHILDGTFSILHEGRFVELKPVDLAANAVSRRGRPAAEPETVEPLPPSAAELAWQRDFSPVVGTDGGFSNPPDDED
jgi:hypothetical protein